MNFNSGTPTADVAFFSDFPTVGAHLKQLAGLPWSVAQASPRIRAVVAIGEAAPDLQAVFADSRPVVVAGSMADAVDAAATLAQAGDAVILAPGCASFDWYRSYAERGDDFVREVRRVIGAAPAAPDTAS